MRWVLGLLLAANLAMFGWWQGWFGGRNPVPPAEANPALLRVVPIDRLGGPPSGSVPAVTSPFASPSAPVSPTQPPASRLSSPTLPAGAPTAAGEPSCREFAIAGDERARALRNALADSGARVEMQRGEAPSSFLVYLPPAASLADAQRQVSSLRQAGIDDVFLMQEGPLRLGVSVGVFSREEGARAVSARVSALGYEVRIAPRPLGAGGWRLTARWNDAATAARGASAAAPFGAESRACDRQDRPAQ